MFYFLVYGSHGWNQRTCAKPFMLDFFQIPSNWIGRHCLAIDKPMSQSPNEAGRHNFVVVLWRQMKVNWFKEIAHGGGKAARQLGGQVAVAIGTLHGGNGNQSAWRSAMRRMRENGVKARSLGCRGPYNHARSWLESYGWMNLFASQPRVPQKRPFPRPIFPAQLLGNNSLVVVSNWKSLLST